MTFEKKHSLNRRRFLTTAGAVAGGLMSAPSLSTASAAETCPAAKGAHAINIVPMPAAVPSREGVAKLSEVGLWYTDSGGDGDAVVFLHPATTSGKVWGYQQPVFAAAGYRFIGYSRRSYAGSDAGPSDSTSSDADDLLQLMDSLGIKIFHGVGVAAGGIRLIDFALSYPDRLKSMVIACTTGGVSDPGYEAVSQTLLPKGFADLPPAFRELSGSYRVGNPEGTKAWEAQVANAIPGKRSRLNEKNVITWEGISRIDKPIMLLTGDADLYMPPAVLDMFAAKLPKAEKHVIGIVNLTDRGTRCAMTGYDRL
ncbi:hypothetical protein PMI07_006447 [Rhizobium sp. CF080]|uniref:alpha/beta fold hydrolase n=1 Tax=Rhizobium sp. (strain CF080) TaxID=1144310 RepID=UPI0002718124|nr:alpha/beta hydrolase [Rhizobium sp. CF080]EUB98133.1 hypothetical protein PMI07_006447 [Rhizobium sp. CF080]